MAKLRRAALILCTALAAPFAGAPAQADPTVVLTGFGDFSGAQTQLGFDDLGLVNGDAVPSQSGASFSLSDGGAVPYYEDLVARESGIGGVGGLSNFWMTSFPYPEVDVSFSSPVHRVAFEARVNTEDQLVVTLLAGGVQVDQLAVPSRGSDMLYFYGFENTGGFDQVRLDALEGATGAFTLDNLTFESLSEPDPEPDPDPDPDPEPDPGSPMVLACDGFESFPRAHHGRHHLPVRALLAELRDADSALVTGSDLEAAPMLRVWFTPDSGGPAVDVTERVAWRGAELSFLGRRLQRWFVWVLPWRMESYGTYMATLESGDPSAYTLDPTCADWTVNQRPKPKHRHHHHGRRGN